MERVVKMTNKEIDDTLMLLNVMMQQIDKGEIIVDDPKFAYVLGRNLRILKTENVEYIDAKNEAMRRYGEYYENETEGTGYRINLKDAEQVKAFQDRVKEVSNIQHDITVFAVPMSVITGWNLPFSYRTALWFLVEEGDELFQ